MVVDPWLERWLSLLAERAAGAPILELGCGSGQDTAVLAAAGHRVVGLDLSPERIAKARERVPAAEFYCQDLRAPFPLAEAGAVLASLSLHYFPWDETMALAARIRAVLRPRAPLLCRLNSTNDRHYGATGHPEIAPHFYDVDGERKRFFDRADVERLFGAGWRFLALEETEVRRYELPKCCWEAVLEAA